MNAGFTVPLFDLMVYLIPGVTLFLGGSLLTGDIIARSLPKPDALAIGIVVLLSFLGGVLVHQATGAIFAVLRRALRKAAAGGLLIREIPIVGYCDHVVLNFEAKTAVQSLAVSQVACLSCNEEIYNHAEAVVYERAPQSAARVARFMALAILCRNSIIPIAILSSAVLLQAKVATGIPRGVAYFSFLTVETLLCIGWFQYWRIGIRTVLRAFLVCQLPNAAGIPKTTTATD